MPVDTLNVCIPGSCICWNANQCASRPLLWQTRRQGSSGPSSPRKHITGNQRHKRRNRANTNCKTNAMMARAVIREPGNPSFVLNFQVRVADWDQVHGTHQGQRLNRMPRSKAGHRTVLTSRAIRAFFPCKADVIHTGETGLLLTQLLLMQHIFASAAASFR